MKKHSTAKKSTRTAKEIAKKASKGKKKHIHQVGRNQRLTVGIDLGDRSSRYCILDEAGEVVSEGSLLTTKAGLSSLFGKMSASRVARWERTRRG
jgi:activator of 2-hydroxyglutaryl-CoA dehydratase